MMLYNTATEDFICFTWSAHSDFHKDKQSIGTIVDVFPLFWYIISSKSHFYDLKF